MEKVKGSVWKCTITAEFSLETGRLVRLTTTQDKINAKGVSADKEVNFVNERVLSGELDKIMRSLTSEIPSATAMVRDLEGNVWTLDHFRQKFAENRV
ncbi:MAG: hypothetical protein AAB536_03020 [Patescibacteria group bacterium]